MDLVKTTSIVYDILFLLVRECMWLSYPTRTISECGDTMMTSKTQEYWMCQMWLGEMCDPEYGCDTCKYDIKEKMYNRRLPHI